MLVIGAVGFEDDDWAYESAGMSGADALSSCVTLSCEAYPSEDAVEADAETYEGSRVILELASWSTDGVVGASPDRKGWWHQGYSS